MPKLRFLFFMALFLFSNVLSAQTPLSAPDSTLVEVQPEFPGGVQSFFKYLSRKFKYPKSAAKILYQGTVIVTIIVDQNGKVVVDSLNFDKMGVSYRNKADEAYYNNADGEMKIKAKADMNAEIRRLFTDMPTWKPGTQNGKPVSVKYTLPYYISLE